MAKTDSSAEASEKTITDFKGNIVKVGDAVIYISKTYCTSCLAMGTVSKIKSAFGKELAYINGSSRGVTSQSFYKV